MSFMKYKRLRCFTIYHNQHKEYGIISNYFLFIKRHRRIFNDLITELIGEIFSEEDFYYVFDYELKKIIKRGKNDKKV